MKARGPVTNKSLSIAATSGCAIRVLEGISHYKNPQQILLLARPLLFDGVTGYEASLERWEDIKDERRYQPFPLFSDIQGPYHDNSGVPLAKLITDNKLGILHQTQERKNWTNKDVTAWLWEIDYEALLAWYAAYDKAHPSKTPEVVAPAEPAVMAGISSGFVYTTPDINRVQAAMEAQRNLNRVRPDPNGITYTVTLGGASHG